MSRKKSNGFLLSFQIYPDFGSKMKRIENIEA